MEEMKYTWINKKRDINLKQYVYYISSYHFNWHNEIELIILLQGEIEVSTDGKNYILEKDDMMIINSNVGHATLARKPDSIAMVIHLDPKYFNSYYDDYHLLEFSLISNNEMRHKEHFNQIRRITIDMIKNIKGTTPIEKIYFESLLHQLVAILVKEFPPKEISVREMNVNKNKTDSLKKIIQYIDNNFKDRITLELLSKKFGYHSSYISQIIKQQLGINYYEYLTRIRLREATYALMNMDKKISDIALSYGFSDVKAFNTTFRDNFGKVPSEYRKQLSQKEIQYSEMRQKRYLLESEFNNIKKDEEMNSIERIENAKKEEIESVSKEYYQNLIKFKELFDSSLEIEIEKWKKI